MSTLTLITVIICAVYVIRADQYVARATVVFENRTIENARVDRGFSNDIQVSEPSGTVHILPVNAIISYGSKQWYLGMFAWGAIVIVLICGVLGIAGPLLHISKAWSQRSKNEDCFTPQFWLRRRALHDGRQQLIEMGSTLLS